MSFMLKLSQDIFQKKVNWTCEDCKAAVGIADDIQMFAMNTHMPLIYMKLCKGPEDQAFN